MSGGAPVVVVGRCGAIRFRGAAELVLSLHLETATTIGPDCSKSEIENSALMKQPRGDGGYRWLRAVVRKNREEGTADHCSLGGGWSFVEG